MEAPVLYMPNQMKPFILETDASKHASGAVLRQQDSNGDWHPCGYLSKSFTETERNYDIGDRELLAVIRALEVGLPKFSSVQSGSSRIFENLEPDFRFGLGNSLNFELDHWFRFRRVRFWFRMVQTWFELFL